MADPGVETTGELTRDGFLGGRFSLLQPKRGLRAGSDAMFLAAAVPAAPGQDLLEGGLGTGAAAIAVLRRVEDTRILGVERHPCHADLARRNAAENGLDDRLAVRQADIASLRAGDLTGTWPAPPFDHAFANPPYFETGRSRAGPSASRLAAHTMAAGELAGWIGRMNALLKPAGTLSVIHRPEALGELLSAMCGPMGSVIVLPLAARTGEPANRVLVQARKGSRAPLRLLAPLILHGPDGSPSAAAEAVLRHGRSIDLAGNGAIRE